MDTKQENDELENRVTQLRKGILELAIMGLLNRENHYGYSLVRVLSREGALNLKEGTIYPILSRMHRDGLVETHWVESSQGPPRKYYSLTHTGRNQYLALIKEFEQLVEMVHDAGQRTGTHGTKKGPQIIVMKESENE
jgi:PadR family transcriptional regulator, regulatory protein PadR